jgi:hypothetical protein
MWAAIRLSLFSKSDEKRVRVTVTVLFYAFLTPTLQRYFFLPQRLFV